MKKKNKDNIIPVWELKGFTDKRHYHGWLHFNGLIAEESTYDTVYRDDFTGETVNLDKE